MVSRSGHLFGFPHVQHLGGGGPSPGRLPHHAGVLPHAGSAALASPPFRPCAFAVAEPGLNKFKILLLTVYRRDGTLLLQIIYMSTRDDDLKADLLQGTLDLLVLKALSAQSLHGLGVSNRISQITNGTFDVKPGSLFPALHRMEEAGWLQAEWGESENNRRAKFYSLTKAGRRQLEAETEDWERISLAIGSALRAS